MPHPAFPNRFVAFFITALGELADDLLRPLMGLFMVLLLVALPGDTYGFLQQPHEYAIGQHLDLTQPHWERQYVLRNLWSIAAVGLILWLIIASYVHPQRPLLRWSCRLVVTALFVCSVFNYWQWALTGFDH